MLDAEKGIYQNINFIFMHPIVNKGQSLNLKELKQWGQNKFIINSEYQRSKMWSDLKKQMLMDSIIRGFPIGTLILKKIDNGKFEVLDGQQRLDAIFNFMEGHLLTSNETEGFRGKNYDDLMADPKRSPKFENYQIFYDEIEGGDDPEIATIFLRLQEGKPLNTAEKLNATLGEMRNFVFNLSRHGIFIKGVKISSFRFTHRLIAAQITLLELGSDFNNEPFPKFCDTRYPDLKEMYEENKTSLPAGLHNRIYGNLDTLYQALGEHARVIRKNSDLPLVYLLTSYLRRKYILNFKLLRDFIINFFTTVAQTSVPEGELPRNQYEKYVELRKKGLTPKSFSERFKILLGLFLNEAPAIILRDQKRDFDVGQKLAIFYNKDNRMCKHCGIEVLWEEADFHHIVYHSKGGPTTVQNGQLMHIKCHRELHKHDNDE